MHTCQLYDDTALHNKPPTSTYRHSSTMGSASDQRFLDACRTPSLVSTALKPQASFSHSVASVTKQCKLGAEQELHAMHWPLPFVRGFAALTSVWPRDKESGTSATPQAVVAHQGLVTAFLQLQLHSHHIACNSSTVNISCFMSQINNQ